jgi:hypothetical protein
MGGEPVRVSHETRMSMSVDSTVIGKRSTTRARHGRERPVEMLRPGRRLVEPQPKSKPDIQLRVMGQLEESNIRRSPSNLLLRGQERFSIQVIYLV